MLHFFKGKEDRKKSRAYEDFISDNALANNSFSITEIKEVEILKTLPLEEDQYGKLAEIIKTADIELIKNLPSSENVFEDLTIIKFLDQNNDAYVAIIYDSYELWEDPVVIEVFRVKDSNS